VPQKTAQNTCKFRFYRDGHDFFILFVLPLADAIAFLAEIAPPEVKAEKLKTEKLK
jgi:hypothetical protein